MIKWKREYFTVAFLEQQLGCHVGELEYLEHILLLEASFACWNKRCLMSFIRIQNTFAL